MQKTWFLDKYYTLSFVFEIFLSSNLLVRRKLKLNCARFLLTLNDFNRTAFVWACYIKTFSVWQAIVLNFRNYIKEN